MYVCGILLGAAAVFYIIPTLFIVWIAGMYRSIDSLMPIFLLVLA